ncbi:MAG: hypothetical protein AMJ79_05670 [Phycisphaerae bacterium SM23_30]|nr:MAG: hypothetical protein AMJ79_05670 [Phycisphaerae bacterium SM23_30]
MKFKLLSEGDLEAIDALKEHHGGAQKIYQTIEEMRDFERRKKILAEKGYGEMIADAQERVKKFPKVGDFEKENNISYNSSFGVATCQVSGFQGAKVTHRCLQRIAETAHSDEPVYVPAEMIAVVALTDNYIYNGDLLAKLTMAENIMQVSKFCNTNMIGIPYPESRFAELEKVTGKTFERTSLGDGTAQLILKNMGTAFGNLGGVEVGNDNHLIYLDGVTRAALTTGGNFYLNPSWSTIIAACYYARDIPNLHFKISMLLSTQNLMQFRMLLNIISEYIRDDMTSPIYEVNIGNAVSAENFIKCSRELDESGIKGISLAAHIRINPDLGLADFDWTENAYKVLESGTNLTYKYESDGTRRELDTMEAYFLSEEDREANAEKIGDVIFYKCRRASQDSREMMKKGIKAVFGGSSY